VRNPAELRRIESFLWADQPDRHRLLRAAAASLPAEGAPLERIGAVEFVSRELSRAGSGLATVLFHSHMWWYLPESDRKQIASCMEEAGARASRAAPLFWLRMEAPSVEFCEVRLRGWPGGGDRLLARAHHHGRWVEWLDAAAARPA
jgi:hypothetical protein